MAKANEKATGMRKLLLIMMAGVAGFAFTSHALSEARSRRRGARVQAKDQVQTWENEGGNVPDVAPVRATPAASDAGH
ncbi:MAG: hypothetical protein ABI771_04390 [Betaproteobacteria bacterium]